MSGRRHRRAGMRPLGPLPSDLVLAAAEASGVGSDEVLDAADVEVLVGIASRARALDDPVAVTAEVLVGVAASRPFGRGNGAAAWLAAMHALARRGLDVEVADDVAVELVRGAGSGRLVERDVVARLRPLVFPAPSRTRRAARALARRLVDAATATRPLEPRHAVCPACARTVGDSARWPLGPGAPVDDRFLVAVCAREHGFHDAGGRAPVARATEPPARWCPVICSSPRGGGRGGPLLALTDDGPVALLPSTEGDDELLDVVALDDLAPSDLIGSWDRLGTRGARIAQVRTDACRLDDTCTSIDWLRLIAAAIPTDELISA